MGFCNAENDSVEGVKFRVCESVRPKHAAGIERCPGVGGQLKSCVNQGVIG